MFELIVDSEFSAAHNLRDYKGACENLHGHNWKVRIVLRSENVNKQGMVIDFKDIKETTNNLINKYDHKYLNELDEFSTTNPTTENISKLLYHKLSKDLPDDVFVEKVTTWESEGFGASYYK